MSPKPGPQPRKKTKKDLRNNLKTKSNREFFKYSKESLEQALAEVRDSNMSVSLSIYSMYCYPLQLRYYSTKYLFTVL